MWLRSLRNEAKTNQRSLVYRCANVGSVGRGRGGLCVLSHGLRMVQEW
jgi:hypothetical protein